MWPGTTICAESRRPSIRSRTESRRSAPAALRGSASARRGVALFALFAAAALSVFLDQQRGRYVTPLADAIPGGDFTGHLVLALGVGLAVNLGVDGVRVFGRLLGPWIATSFVVAFFTLEEMSQRLAPGRQVRLQDVAASVLGAAIAGALYSAWVRRRARSRLRADSNSDATFV